MDLNEKQADPFGVFGITCHAVFVKVLGAADIWSATSKRGTCSGYSSNEFRIQQQTAEFDQQEQGKTSASENLSSGPCFCQLQCYGMATKRIYNWASKMTQLQSGLKQNKKILINICSIQGLSTLTVYIPFAILLE